MAAFELGERGSNGDHRGVTHKRISADGAISFRVRAEYGKTGCVLAAAVMREAAREIAVGGRGRLPRPPARDARKSPLAGYFAIASCKKRGILWVIAP